MIEAVKTHPAAYCIVHGTTGSPATRRRRSDPPRPQRGQRVRLATRTIDETPSGMLLHGIMSIAEFYSATSPTRFRQGHEPEGTTGNVNARAPIGYLNVRKRDELGREMRVVEPDPDRAALVKWAFEAHATGNYSTITS